MAWRYPFNCVRHQEDYFLDFHFWMWFGWRKKRGLSWLHTHAKINHFCPQIPTIVLINLVSVSISFGWRDGIFYARINGMGLVIRRLLFCTHNTSLCGVHVYRFWNGQIAPHPLADFGFALGRPPTHIYALPTAYVHVHHIFKTSHRSTTFWMPLQFKYRRF